MTLVLALNSFIGTYLTNVVTNTLLLCYLLTWVYNRNLTIYGLFGGVMFGSQSAIVLLPGLSNPLSYVHPIILLVGLVKLKSNQKAIPIFIIWLSLGLGGWWASQEFNWGGWWNWDLIETPIALISVYFLIQFHISRSLLASYRQVITMYSHITLMLYILINTRFLDTSSIHSFITKGYFVEWVCIFMTNDLVVFFNGLVYLIGLSSYHFLANFVILGASYALNMLFGQRNFCGLRRHHFLTKSNELHTWINFFLIVFIFLTYMYANYSYFSVFYLKNLWVKEIKYFF